MGMIDVRAPVNSETIAIAMSITPEARYTSADTGLAVPSTAVMSMTSRPMKASVRPSMIHSMARMCRLSADIGPKLLMIPLVGMAT